jgi:CheY-like chemotaxis protein
VDAMMGHYVEDDALDALALTGMLGGEDGISLTTSTSLEDFGDWLSGGELDFVLVDIYRPDSLPFEEEIKRIRIHTHAPVFFITGDEAKYYLTDALEVGAKGVLEKEALTADGLVAALESVSPQAGGKEKPEEASLIALAPADWDTGGKGGEFAALDPERFEGASRYIGDALRKAASLPADAANAARIFSAIADAHTLLKTYVCDPTASHSKDENNVRHQAGRPVPQVIRHLQRGALALAKQRGVKLVFQTTASIFGEAAPPSIDTAIRSVLNAVMMGVCEGTTLRFNGLMNCDGVRLSISSDAPLPFNVDDITGRNLPADPRDLGPTVLMTALVMLLGLDAHQLTVFQRGELSTILIDIQDE